MRETNFKYRPIPDVQQQNEPDEDGKISKHPAEPAPDHEAISSRAEVRAQPSSHARSATLFGLFRRIVASYEIFFIIGEQS